MSVTPRPSRSRTAAAPPTRPRGVKGHTIETYRARRDFSVTAEPAPAALPAPSNAPIFVVQKHDATRLHWDFRLEHGGVLWSWAVPRGPSLDPHDKRLAVHVEDHPLDYADFHGTIPEGQYGAGTVETWDSGTWTFAGPGTGDPAAALAKGEIKVELAGTRLNGRFVLVRLKPRPKEHAENWLLIKEHDEHESAGRDAAAIEADTPPAAPRGAKRIYGQDDAGPAPEAADEPPAETPSVKTPPAGKPRARAGRAKTRPADAPGTGTPPAPGAQRGKLPTEQAPQLATLVEAPPEEGGWLSEVKFDGYRMLAFVEDGTARMVTRNGLDWTRRMPHVAEAVSRLGVRSALIDGELVALREDGVSHFGDLQAALSEKRDQTLFFYAFDLLHLDGWDLRACKLVDRKAALHGLSDWRGTVRYSDHVADNAGAMRRQACSLGLEGIIAKQADAPYRAGRTRGWLKAKCQGRDEFLVVGWTPPAGSRVGLGALHLGFHDEQRRLHYAGGVGTGFSEAELKALRRRLDALAAERPAQLLLSGDPIDRAIIWVRPELVAEVQYLSWSGSGRLRHATYLGLREDKAPGDVVHDIPDPNAERHELGKPARARIVAAAPPPKRAAARKPAAAPQNSSRETGATTVARAPARQAASEELDGVRITHPDRELWPGISKHDLAAYWCAVSKYALPEIAGRPLALVRCPEGFAGEHFFQKHGKPGFPRQIRAGTADGAPYLAIDDEAGLVAAAQVAAIELHAWGAAGSDPLHPDRVIFDLDPGDGVAMSAIVAAAKDVRARLAAVGLTAFCRTSGGKGLHVVAPVTAGADWDSARAWCRAFAETMEKERPDLYVASVSKARRTGRILVDWLRNGLGSTAVASFSPRARPGAGVATPLDWREVTDGLDAGAFTLATVPARLANQRRDAWHGFDAAAVPLPLGDAKPAPKRGKK